MTVEQLNRTKLDPLSFRLYAALLCESDMSVNRLAHKTGMTRRTISKKLPLLLDEDLAVKTNSESKVATYSGIDRGEPINSTVELNSTPVESNSTGKHESNSTTGESISAGVESNDTSEDDFRGELGGVWEKYS